MKLILLIFTILTLANGAWGNESSEKLLKEGEALLKKRLYDDAMMRFMEVTKIDPQRAAGWANIGSIYLQMRKLKEAIPYLEKAVLLDQNDCASYSDLSFALYQLTHLEDALKVLEKGKQHCPTNYSISAGLDAVKKELGK